MTTQIKKPRHLDTSPEDIQAIKQVANQDFFQVIGCFVDETSKIDRSYSQLLLWQIWSSAWKSTKTMEANADHYKKKYDDSNMQGESETGQEIAEQNHNYLIEQGQTWRAMYDKYKAIEQAAAKLYEQIAEEHPSKRKIVKYSQGNVRTLKDMTPQEIADVKRVSTDAFGY